MVKPNATPREAMSLIYYSAAWTEYGCLVCCWHEHKTVGEAATCIPCAGGYLVGVKNDVMRSLRPEEEPDFQSAIQNHPSGKPAPHITVPAAASAEQASSDSGYAVMTRIWVVDHWTWATWMCFDTYAQAVAHARKRDKVVRFSSEEWAALKQQKWAKQPQQTDAVPAIHMNAARETLPSRVEGEPLVEFVLRLLSALDPAGPIPNEGQRLTSESDKQRAMIETPTYIARLILSRLSESEIAKLARMRENDIPALLNALRDRSQTVASNKSRCQ
jgi:hypothetical protein